MECEVLATEHERNPSAFTGLQSNALESLELLHRARDVADQVAYVQLHNFIRLHPAFIANHCLHRDFLARLNFGITDFNIRISKFRIGQPVTKGVKGLVAGIQVEGCKAPRRLWHSNRKIINVGEFFRRCRPAGVLVSIVNGHLANHQWERRRQLAGR